MVFLGCPIHLHFLSVSLVCDGIFFGPCPQVSIADFLWPSDLQDVPQAAVDKDVQLAGYGADMICFGYIIPVPP